MPDPLVSVIISSYNRPEMLRSAIESVIHQTYTNLEIIVQDDSTTDDCGDAVNDYTDDRVTYTRNKPPLGTGVNLRDGYRKSRGKYFCTLNDDDRYHCDYIKTMVEVMESDPDYTLGFSDHYIIDAKGDINEIETEKNTAQWGRSTLQEGCVSNPLEEGLVRRSIPAMFSFFRRSSIDLEDFPAEVSAAYDWWLTYLALRTGGSAYYTPKRLTYYRVHQGSQTATFADPKERLRDLNYRQYILNRFLADSQLRSIHALLYTRLATVQTTEGFAWLRLADRGRAYKSFLLSCKTKLSKAAVAGLIFCVLPKPVWEYVDRRKKR
jgi:glycosyltransferase involved in cell wall biosynthesis